MTAQTLTPEQLAYALQFRHPEKQFALMPGCSDQLFAELEGIDVAHYRELRQGYAERARAAATDLLAQDRFAALVDALPFRPGQTVVGFGDSITDDLQSWFEILRHLLDLRRPDDRIRCLNLGYSGDTTTHAICRFAAVVEAQPDWLICMLGTNDVRRHGRAPSKVLVSPDETARNLEMLVNYATTETHTQWLWLTPASVREAAIADFWSLGRLGMAWRNADLDVVADLVRARPEPTVDLQQVFGRPADPLLLLEDGLHPALAGQQKIVTAVVNALAT